MRRTSRKNRPWRVAWNPLTHEAGHPSPLVLSIIPLGSSVAHQGVEHAVADKEAYDVQD
jgi:hypothetical protein